MLTPQEVAEHAFAKATFGGYNMAMVDEFLDILTDDYGSLYKENAVLKGKMKVLVDKVEEYRSTEDAMRMTLLSAQKMANSIVAEAESQKAVALRDAEQGGAQQVAAIHQEIENEKMRLVAAQNATAAYVMKVKAMLDDEKDYLGRLSELVVTTTPDRVDTMAQEIAHSVQYHGEPVASETQAHKEAQVAVEEEDAFAPFEANLGGSRGEAGKSGLTLEDMEFPFDDESEDVNPVRTVNLEHLQFGKDYELK